MKKLLFIAALFISIIGHAQLKIVENHPVEDIGKVKNLFDTALEATKRGEVYTIMYRDAKFTQITEFKHFSMNEESFNQLYELIMSNWNNPPKEDIMIDLEQGYLWIIFNKSMGVTSVRFSNSVDENGKIIGFSQWLTQRQLKKLFGK